MMRVLFVCREDPLLGVGSFVSEQAESLRRLGVGVDFLTIKKGGAAAYLGHVARISRYLDRNRVDCIHAFYGLSGLTALFQSRTPLVVSYLGCDINRPGLRRLCEATVSKKATRCLFMSSRMLELATVSPKNTVLKFGIDFERFQPRPQNWARERLGLNPAGRYVLFASSFDRPEKNPALAKEAVRLLGDPELALLELNRRIPDPEVPLYYNACDALLMTSLREGSPQVIKEAMASDLPVVSTDVGDVAEILGDTPGCRLTDSTPSNVVRELRSVLEHGKPTGGRQRLLSLGLDLESVARRLVDIYRGVVS